MIGEPRPGKVVGKATREPRVDCEPAQISVVKLEANHRDEENKGKVGWDGSLEKNSNQTESDQKMTC